MVDISAMVSDTAAKSLDRAFRDYATALKSHADTAPRRAAIQICKSFRAATKQSPKFARAAEYTITPSADKTKPQFITKPGGVKLKHLTINRPIRGAKYDVYDVNKASARRNRLKLFHRGLAKQSWGWVMHNIFSGAAPDKPWKRRKLDKRDPKEATSGSFSGIGIARIANRLDYIGDALKVSVDAVMQKAVNWMMHETLRRSPKT